MNISIPDDLRRRMQRSKAVTNWSEVAADAFERRLGEIAANKEDKKMSDVIQRLRASKLEHASEAAKEGAELGRWWASERAEYGDLKRLAELKAEPDWDVFLDSSPGDAFGPGERLVGAIVGEDISDLRIEARDFWAALIDDERLVCDKDFVRGFAEGAIALFDEVEDMV